MTTRSSRRFRGLAMIATLSVVGLGLSACGSSSDSSVSSGSTTSAGAKACVAKANDYLKQWEAQPTDLPKSPPARYTNLASPPPSGKTVAYISQSFPAAVASTKSATSIAKSIGWTVKSYIYNSTVPDFIAKVESAIAAKPDFIIEGGLPAAAFPEQIKKAKAAGIAVIIGNTLEKPTDTTGFAAVVDGPGGSDTLAKIQSAKFLSDSKCSGNVAIFTLDYPILKYSTDEFTKLVAEDCPKCKVTTSLIQAKDLGTPAATAQIVSKLQASPNVKYAYTQLGDISVGVSQSLKTAGITDVKIFGDTPNTTSIADLRAGNNAWWVNQNPTIQGWDTIDAAVRILATGKPVLDQGGYPLSLLTKETLPAGNDVPVIPSNLEELYKATWGVK